jgi:TonB family protein
MIASWMLYAGCVSALVTLAALAAERAFSAFALPRRFVWATALNLSALWPLLPTIERLLAARPRPVSVLPFTIVLAAPTRISADAAAAAARIALLDKTLVVLWIALSTMLAWRLLHGAQTLQRSRTAWKRGRVNGVRVQLSDNVGPAVVGLRSMDVVMPEWVLSLDETLREIVLRHEEEHRAARDPYLLFGAAALVALMPWNIALWIQTKRLRLAIEMDCDARVLRAHPSPERYGLLILTIAQRRSIAPTLFAPMLSEPTSNLERRILAMRTTKKVTRVTAAAGALVAMGVLAFASTLQSAPMSFPTAKIPKAVAQVAQQIVPVALPETIPVAKKKMLDSIDAERRKPLGPNEVRKLQPVQATAGARYQYIVPAPEYPEMLRAAQVEGAVVARYAFDGRGNVDPNTIQIVSSTHGLLRASVIKALSTAHGAPNSEAQNAFIFLLDEKSGQEIDRSSLPANAIVVRSTSVGAAASEGPRPVNENQTYFEFQTEKQVSPMPGNIGPRYPDELRAAGVEGTVLAQVVVDTLGYADMSTFKVLKSDHDLFTNAVKQTLPGMRFYPAEVGNRKVKQLLQMPFQFNLSKTP